MSDDAVNALGFLFWLTAMTCVAVSAYHFAGGYAALGACGAAYFVSRAK
jgi:hypothetical protein